MKKLHLAISTDNITASITDYSKRLSASPCVVVEGEYALWRTEYLNVSIRHDQSCPVGSVRHLGWEDPGVHEFTKDTDVNGIVWECFSAENQAEEIKATWPQADYNPRG